MRHRYVANGKTIALPVEHDLLAVRFHPAAGRARRAAASRDAGLGPNEHRVALPHERFTLHPLAPLARPRRERHAAALEALAAHPHVVRAATVYRLGSAHVVATDRAIVGFAPGARDPEAVLARRGARVLERHEAELLVELPHDRDPLEFCAEVRSLSSVAFAEPDFVTIGHRAPRWADRRERGAQPRERGAAPRPAPNADVARQYALAITRAAEAWAIQAGDPAIRIAILDEGVQTPHPSLRRAIVATYDGTSGRRKQEPKPWDPHGTGCAGLAAAAGRTMKGVASGCSLMAARIGYTPTAGGAFVTKQWWVKRAVDWAWQNGADVLSNSWGGVAESTAITLALDRARTRGRGGKGCVLVAAAGNDEVLGGHVEFPGTLPTVLTVAASNEYDEPKTTKSRDNERWWGSSYGPEVDIAAPGVDNYSCDLMGRPGYTTTSYVPDFNGTSSATPIVAGAAALVLAANGDLTEADVRRVLCETADKVGSIPYVEGRNDHMGYGRLNVERAVRAARAAGAPAERGGARKER